MLICESRSGCRAFRGSCQNFQPKEDSCGTVCLVLKAVLYRVYAWLCTARNVIRWVGVAISVISVTFAALNYFGFWRHVRGDDLLEALPTRLDTSYAEDVYDVPSRDREGYFPQGRPLPAPPGPARQLRGKIRRGVRSSPLSLRLLDIEDLVIDSGKSLS